jgi:hypothetical protein
MRDAARLLGEGPIEIQAVPWWFHFNITDSEGDRVFERTHSCPLTWGEFPKIAHALQM